MTATNDIRPLERLGLYFIIFIFIGMLFEVGLLVFAFINADKVECNLLWCTFTDVRSSKSFTETYSECFVNGKQVNCSQYQERYPDMAHHGENSLNGVCPGWNENKSISDCIEEIERLK